MQQPCCSNGFTALLVHSERRNTMNITSSPCFVLRMGLDTFRVPVSLSCSVESQYELAQPPGEASAASHFHISLFPNWRPYSGPHFYQEYLLFIYYSCSNLLCLRTAWFLASSFLALHLDTSSKGDENQAHMYFVVNGA